MTEIIAKHHPPTYLGNLARAAGDLSTPMGRGAAQALVTAVLEYEAAAAIDTAEAIEQAIRLWPEQWADSIHDAIPEIEYEAGR